MKRIVVEPEKCTGCRDCELVCSIKQTGEFNPARAQIKAVYFPEEMVNVPLTCLHCQVPLCMEACPTEAFSRDQATDAVVVAQDKCIGCYMCITACPVGAIRTVPDQGVISKCELCQGEPACVEICSAGVLSYQEIEELSIARSRNAAAELKKVIKGVDFR
ncbi:MAG: 4Fe-4S dicluster domain-containing protein [Halanaerobiales bacterium]|nr:4Fe-4S dicluster domain-containing protein [Halanaerobiales bacterium]